MATDLAKLVVKLEAQTAQYQRSLDQANKQLSKFNRSAASMARNIGKGIAAAATAAAGGLAYFGKQAIDNADRLSKLSQTLGVSTEALSQLEYAADLSGTSSEQLTTALGKLAKQALLAARDGGASARAFENLGVQVTDAQGAIKPTEQLLLEIADRFASLEDGATKAALAQEVFGRAGAALIPFLNQGKDGIRALTDEADRLGVTLSTTAGRAAEEFNDNLTRLQTAAKGVVNQAMQQLLPALVSITDAFVRSATQGGNLSLAIALVAKSFQTLITVGTLVKSTFDEIGLAIYGTASAVVRIMQGEFRLAVEEYRDAARRASESWQNSFDLIEKVWGEAPAGLEAAAGQMDQALGESIVFNPPKAAKVAKESADNALWAIESMYRDMDEATQTSLQRQLAAWTEFDAKVAALLAAGRISEDDAAARIAENNAQYLEEIQITAEKIFPEPERKQLSVFMEEASRNFQNLLADFLFDPFDKGIKGMLDSFLEMLRRMAAEAVAAQIAQKIFGQNLGGGGWLDAALGAVTAAIGGGGSIGLTSAQVSGGLAQIGALGAGGRASGGPVHAGVAYRVGDQGRAEWFIPTQAGRISQDRGDRSMNVQQTFAIQAPSGTVSRATEQQIAAAAARGLAQANRRNN